MSKVMAKNSIIGDLSWLDKGFTLEEEGRELLLQHEALGAARPPLVLCCHGYRDKPSTFKGLADAIFAAGYDVYVPRINGHGSDVADFEGSGASHWLRSLIDSYLRIWQQGAYRELLLLGLSMGGLLASILAERLQPKRVVLLAPAFFLHSKLIQVSPLLAIFTNHVPKKFEVGLRRETSSLQKAQAAKSSLEDSYCRYHQPPQLAGVLQLMCCAKRSIKAMAGGEAKFLCLLSENDLVVRNGKVASFLQARLGDQLQSEIIAGASHVAIHPEEGEGQLGLVLGKLLPFLGS